jgi:membrane protein DedA with SNARE-associated domain
VSHQIDPTSSPGDDPTLGLGLDATLVTAGQLRPHDQVPGIAQHLHNAWLAGLSTSGRDRVALLVAIVGIAAASIFLGARLLRILLGLTDLGAYLGLFIVNWVANGGLLVPIPGLRIVGWLLIISQGAALDPAIAGFVGGIAMALGQTSFYVAGDAGRRRSSGHDTAASGPPRHARLARLSSGPRVVRTKERITQLIRVHGFATISVLSLVPTPLTTFGCATAGAMGMGFRRFVLASLLGRIALGLILAYLGSGLEQLFDRAHLF